jgi:membrane-associated protein
VTHFLQMLADALLHADVFVDAQVGVWGAWTYLLMFFVIFCETGLVVTPFLPGDSLLFVAGALAARPGDPLSSWLLILVMAAAAILGDTANYWIGKALGPRLLSRPNSRVFRREYLDRTHAFFERYGAKTVILARFVPIIRTFAPFLAGVGTMRYRRFLEFNVVGGVAWVLVFLLAGFFFGRIPAVSHNLSMVLIGVVVVTTIPILVEYVRSRGASRSVTPDDVE